MAESGVLKTGLILGGKPFAPKGAKPAEFHCSGLVRFTSSVNHLAWLLISLNPVDIT